MRRPANAAPITYAVVATALGIATIVLGLGATAVAGERVELRDGRTIVGEITSNRDGTLEIRTATGTETVSREDVRRIARVRKGTDDAQSDASSDAGRETPAESRPPVRRDDPATGAARAGGTAVAGTPGSTGARASATKQRGAAPSLTAEQIQELRADLESAAKSDPAAADVVDLLVRMESQEPLARVDAMEAIASDWPEMLKTLRIVMVVGSDGARLDGARLLRDARLGDPTDLCESALQDRSVAVRIQAMRAIREKRLRSFEKQVLAILSGDEPWTVRQEAARTLERIGGRASFSTAVWTWGQEHEPRRKRRLKRLLCAIAGTDLGDDADVWNDAVWRAETGELELGSVAERRRSRLRLRRSEPARGDEQAPAELPVDDR